MVKNILGWAAVALVLVGIMVGFMLMNENDRDNHCKALKSYADQGNELAQVKYANDCWDEDGH